MKDIDTATTILGVKPVKGMGRGEPVFKEDEVLKTIAEKLILQDSTYFKDNAKYTNIDYEKAAEILNKNEALYTKAIDDFVNKTRDLSQTIKTVTANVRDSAEKLSQGIIKCQKTADFNNLERYVLLLERAATALTTLGELENNGKLEKIAKALK
jgi:hypothetical protein